MEPIELQLIYLLSNVDFFSYKIDVVTAKGAVTIGGAVLVAISVN